MNTIIFSSVNKEKYSDTTENELFQKWFNKFIDFLRIFNKDIKLTDITISKILTWYDVFLGYGNLSDIDTEIGLKTRDCTWVNDPMTWKYKKFDTKDKKEILYIFMKTINKFNVEDTNKDSDYIKMKSLNNYYQIHF